MKPAHGVMMFVAGAIMGGAAALLFAPEKGTKTRRNIKRFFEDEREKLMDTVDDVRAGIQRGEKKVEKAIKSYK